MTIRGKSSDNTGSKIAQHYATMSKAGSHKVGLDVLPKIMFPLLAIASTVEAGSTKKKVVLTAHGAREGDIIRFVSGLNDRVEASIHSIIDANTMELGVYLDNTPIVTDTFFVMRHITLTSDKDGALSTSSGPIQYIRDTIVQQVIKDTATPSNTRALPVELVSTTGIEATFNVTTGDLNIATTHDGLVPDSMQIGDGTNLMAVNVSLEATVRDGDAITELVAIKALDFSTEVTSAAILTELALKADLSETQPVSLASQPLPTGAATEASLLLQSAKLPSVIGSNLDADSLSVTQSTEDKAISALTNTKLDAILADLALKADLVETQPVSMASQPLPTGAATEATLLTIQSSIDSQAQLAPVDFLDSGVVDSSATNILVAGTSLVASLAADCKEIEIVDDIGEYMSIRDGVGTVLAYMPLGGGRVKVSIPAATNIKIYSETGGTILLGSIAINFLG